MLKIGSFTGEVPRTHPRLLPDTAAQLARNTRLENGALVPVRQPRLDAAVSADTETIYRHLGSWLTWNVLVNAAPGPVASERLYYTGDGAPKMRVSGTVYPLALARPSGHLYTELVEDSERLTIDGREILLSPGRKGKTQHGWRYSVTKGDNPSDVIVTCAHTGANLSTTRLLINTLRYRNASNPLTDGVRTVEITSASNTSTSTVFGGLESFVDVGSTGDAPSHTTPTDDSGASVSLTVNNALGHSAFARIYFQSPYAGSVITGITADGTTIMSTGRTIYSNTDIRTFAKDIVEEINSGSHGYTASYEMTSAYSGYDQVVITVYASGSTAANGDAFSVTGTGKSGATLVSAGGQINWTTTFTGGSADDEITSIEIDGVELLTSGITYSTPSGTASAIASAVNSGTTSPDYTAVADGNVVTIYSEDSAAEAAGRSVAVSGSVDIEYDRKLSSASGVAVDVTPLDPVFTTGASAQTLFGSVVVASDTPVTEVVFSVRDMQRAVIDSEDFQSILWAYTWVTEFDEESEPSDLSVARPWSSGNKVALTNWASPPSGRGVDRVRIYRSQTSALGETNLYFVAEVALSALGTSWVDDPEENEIQELCPSTDYNPPPDGLTGLIALPNGMMAAFVGKDLYFSEPWIPHAWPEKYTLTTESDIVALGAFGSSVAVLTSGTPYVAQGTTPDAMSMERLEVDLPCITARGVVDLGYMVAYPSTDGLVAISSSGAQIVSGSLFTREQWQALDPSSFRASRYSGRYVLSYIENFVRKSILLDLSGQSQFVVRSDSALYASFSDAGSGKLFFVEGTGVFEFDCLSNPRMSQTWRSKPFVLPAYTNFGAILLEAEPGSGESATAKVYADGVLKATVTTSNTVARLPSGFMARQWEVEISGTAPVTSVTMAVSPREIAGIS